MVLRVARLMDKYVRNRRPHQGEKAPSRIETLCLLSSKRSRTEAREAKTRAEHCRSLLANVMTVVTPARLFIVRGHFERPRSYLIVTFEATLSRDSEETYV